MEQQINITSIHQEQSMEDKKDQIHEYTTKVFDKTIPVRAWGYEIYGPNKITSIFARRLNSQNMYIIYFKGTDSNCKIIYTNDKEKEILLGSNLNLSRIYSSLDIKSISHWAITTEI